jgi:hypothetical protein
MALESGMPRDPFGVENSQELTVFAAGCYAMFTSLLAAGFTEVQALRVTIDLMASMMQQAKTAEAKE